MKCRSCFCLISIVWMCLMSRAALAEATFTLQNVLRSVENHYPLILKAQIDVESQASSLKAAQGGFYDPKLNASTRIKRGYYDNDSADFYLKQNTPLWGASIKAGWRMGSGDFAVYDDILETLSGGEYYIGLLLPLLRGGKTDDGRTKIAKVKIEQDIARFYLEYEIRKARYEAALAFYEWQMRLNEVSIARRLLSLAKQRQGGIEKKMLLGASSALSLVENQQIIQKRRAKLVKAKQQLNSAALQLSLYYRDASGNRVVLDSSYRRQMPGKMHDVIISADSNRSREQILQEHPLVRAYELKIAKQQVDVANYRNKTLPQWDVEMKFSNDELSGPKNLNQPEMTIQSAFEFPLPNRKARGEYDVSRLRERQTKLDYGFLQDKLAVKIDDLLQKIKHSRMRMNEIYRQWQMANQMLDGEYTKFEAGDSDLFRLAIREEYVADAYVEYLFSWFDLNDYAAEYRLILAGNSH